MPRYASAIAAPFDNHPHYARCHLSFLTAVLPSADSDPFIPAKSLSKIDTIYSADSLEFSPHHPSIFVVGTYQLEPAQPVASATPARTSVLDGGEGEDGEVEVEMVTPAAKRKGRLLVYEADERDGTMYVDCFWAGYQEWKDCCA